jgi:GTP-binding protein
MQFLDEVKIYLKSGDGGNGCVSFRREKFIDMGGPDGGNGGRGGDIVFRCASGLNTLIDFRYKQHFKASCGQGGMGRNRNGKSADQLVLTVPVGTQIFSEDRSYLLYDFTVEGQEFVLINGGNGGIGNCHFKSSINRAPKRRTEGKPGEEMWVWLQLKLISDIGLLGLPNAGKSTFLSKVSAARPKIADYPFTTLKPQLGVTYVDEQEFVIADIPGLIKGASEGHGLGVKFLKHLERCGALLHLIDATAEDIIESYNIIQAELKSYGISDKEEIIALNKVDSLTDDVIKAKVKELKKHLKKDIYPISCVSGEGIKAILRVLRDKIFPQIEE